MIEYLLLEVKELLTNFVSMKSTIFGSEILLVNKLVFAN